MTRTFVELASGARIAYESHGEAAPSGAPTLLLLHGFTLDRRMWAPQVAELAAHYRVVSYDARGFGESSVPGSEPFAQCDDAAELCERLDLAPVIAVGHSIGAHQMLELALTRPDLVCGFAAIALSGLASVPFSDDLKALFAALSATARDQGRDAAKALWASAGWFAAARETPAVAAVLDQMLRDYSGWHWFNERPSRSIGVGLCPTPPTLGSSPPLRSGSIKPAAATRLAELVMPALVINGGRDLPYNQRVGEALAAGIPHARHLTLPEVGHMPGLEAPAAVNAALLDLAARCGA